MKNYMYLVFISTLMSISGCISTQPSLEERLLMEKRAKENADNEKYQETLRNKRVERQNKIQSELNRIKTKQGKFCKPFDLSEALLNPYFSNNQANCVYVIGRAYKVIQSIPNGVLVGFIGFNEFDPKIIHIKTNQKFIDGQFINPMYVKPNGLFNYITAFQTQKTVSSFIFLEFAPQFLFNEY